MSILILICWLLGLIFFGLAAFAIPAHPRFGWVAAGLFFVTLAEFLSVITGTTAKVTS